jgi:spermidine synthase
MKTLGSSRAALLAFVTAFTTLFVQILVHRLVSAKLVNNLAFLVISVTMLGFALSGVLLTRWRDAILRRLGDAACACAGLFALTLIASAAVFCRAEAESGVTTRLDFVVEFARIMPLALLFTVPFAFCGLLLGALLSAPDLPSRRIYFFDLLGSAAGALIVVPAITRLGVERALVAGAAAFLLVAVAAAPPRASWARASVVAGGLCVAVAMATSGSLFAIVYPKRTMLREFSEPGSGAVIEHIAWDPLARIEVSRVPPPDPRTFSFPSLIGGDRAFHSRFKRLLTQNNNALTFAVEYDGRRESLRGIEQTIYAAAYQATSRPRPNVLVIGVGGGFDVLNALYFDASKVTGVEVNGATVGILRDTYRDYFRPWREDPRVRVVHAEGRDFLASTGDRFDVIQLSGVDSASGTPAATHVFMENYLYTAEAFDLFLDRLTPGGILNVMRLEWNPPREMLRSLTTAVGALRRAGVANPVEHVATVTAADGGFVAMLVKKTPFRDEELRKLEGWAGASPYFALSASPRLRTSPSGAPANVYQYFLGLQSAQAERAFIARYPFDVSPVVDDRPFFFRSTFWWHLFTGSPLVRATVPVMELSLVLLIAMLVPAALTSVWLPLRWLTVRGERAPSPWRPAVFFAATGLGYLAIEVALLQHYGLFLGHPNYALSVVLAALLFSSGLGSLYSAAVERAFGAQRFVAYALAVLVLLEQVLVAPRLVMFTGAPLWARAIVVSALVFPVGILLGTFLPGALERLKTEDPAFVPWAWGINGIFSVVAPILSVAVSMTWGIQLLLLAALPVYLVAGWVLPDRRVEALPEATLAS